MTIDLNRLSDSTELYEFIALFTVSYFQSENLKIPGYDKRRQFRQFFFFFFFFQESYKQHQQNVNSTTRISQKTFLKVCPPSSSISSFWEHIISKKQTIKEKKHKQSMIKSLRTNMGQYINSTKEKKLY